MEDLTDQNLDMQKSQLQTSFFLLDEPGKRL